MIVADSMRPEIYSGLENETVSQLSLYIICHLLHSVYLYLITPLKLIQTLLAGFQTMS